MRTGSKILAMGSVIAAPCPIVAIFALASKRLLGCDVPRHGPCMVGDIDVGWLEGLARAAEGFSWATVPLGLLICAFGLTWLLVGFLGGALRERTPSARPQASEPAGISWRQPLSLARFLLEWMVGIAAMLIFAFAAGAPETGGRILARGTAVLWQIAGVLGVLLSVWVTIEARRYTPLVLLASTLLFFASCTANFHWLGG